MDQCLFNSLTHSCLTTGRATALAIAGGYDTFPKKISKGLPREKIIHSIRDGILANFYRYLMSGICIQLISNISVEFHPIPISDI